MGIAALRSRNAILALISSVMLSCVGLSVVVADRAAAQQTKCGARANYWAGYQSAELSHSGSGARADISVYRGAVCDVGDISRNNFSTAWVLLRAPSDSTLRPVPYAQVGYKRHYGTGIEDFTEYRPPHTSVFYDQFFSARSSGSTVHYMIYIGADNYYHMSANGVDYGRTPFSWYAMSETSFCDASGDFGPCDVPQWMSETTYRESDIPGVPGRETRFSKMQQGVYGVGWKTATPDRSQQSNAARWDISNLVNSSYYGLNFLSWTYADLP